MSDGTVEEVELDRPVAGVGHWGVGGGMALLFLPPGGRFALGPTLSVTNTSARLTREEGDSVWCLSVDHCTESERRMSYSTDERTWWIQIGVTAHLGAGGPR